MQQSTWRIRYVLEDIRETSAGPAGGTVWADNAPLAGQKVRQCYALRLFRARGATG